MSFKPAEQAPTLHGVGALPPATSNLGDARDLRNLLEAVLEAVTLPTGTPDYERRILDRAVWVRATLKGALAEDPADIGWDTDFLRGKLRAEETEAAARAAQASVDRAFPIVAAFLADDRTRGESR
ncbi:hypothetical protein ACF090_13115 [Streptomyces sp. NPDC014892]|uniref:hypothetical protein n=1 Tax=Streptomyces sp. NPDC014892 TaxID=3364930 RepID=UPI0036FB37CF